MEGGGDDWYTPVAGGALVDPNPPPAGLYPSPVGGADVGEANAACGVAVGKVPAAGGYVPATGATVGGNGPAGGAGGALAWPLAGGALAWPEAAENVAGGALAGGRLPGETLAFPLIGGAEAWYTPVAGGADAGGAEAG
ncbi:hypothetical protein KZZ52_00540 [Dactylosporangium sp. AC04546]|uniref:hypothetical protein n=1 Tax=Dactylosporangium sp. AC04546 TaxID=2862460 RepID=UPI002E7B8FF7|nr:hypothetical protein [Dactylosporangium sp. AC04546]WVK83976.1 hypothetical protein KZZ52_00540 [Dactylosporangium sp. AC04546]